MTNVSRSHRNLSAFTILLRYILNSLSWLIPDRFKRMLLLSTAVRIWKPEVLESDVLVKKLSNVLQLAKYPEAVTSQKLVYKWVEETEFSGVVTDKKNHNFDLNSISHHLALHCPKWLRYGRLNDMKSDIMTAFTAVTAIDS